MIILLNWNCLWYISWEDFCLVSDNHSDRTLVCFSGSVAYSLLPSKTICVQDVSVLYTIYTKYCVKRRELCVWRKYKLFFLCLIETCEVEHSWTGSSVFWSTLYIQQYNVIPRYGGRDPQLVSDKWPPDFGNVGTGIW